MRRILGLIVGLIMMPTIGIQAASFNNENWLSKVEGSTSLSRISIPGTHDSGALYEPVAGTAKCQELTIEEQLEIGVRYLDMRCRHIGDAFTIHHGPVYQHLNFDDVLTTCQTFLEANPSECIIMSIKEEYNSSETTRSFEETFADYYNKYEGLFYTGNSIPILEQARGKIIIVRRFPSNTSYGINATSWADNTTFTISSSKIKVQDAYKVSDTSDKWNAITALYEEAASQSTDYLYLNYTSGYKSFLGVPRIKDVSKVIVPNIKEYFAEHTSGTYGVSVIDFIDKEAATAIINTNF